MGYKNIVWVEDFDENESNNLIDDLDNHMLYESIDRTKSIEDVFTNLYCDYVKVIEDLKSALDFFDNNFGDFDCIILDVNLKKTMPYEDEEINIMFKRLEEEGIAQPNDRKELEDNGGYYLYLYLLCKGFPKNRIFIRTAYKGTLSPKWDSKFNDAGLIPPYTLDKMSSNNRTMVDKIQELYSSNNRYYLIRKIIFEACDYWLNIEENRDCCDKILFNKVVKDSNKIINLGSVKDILLEIKAICPLLKPQKENSLYLQLLKIITMPFEADIDYKKLNQTKKNGNNNVIAYYNIMKLCRNWNAHNKFVSEPTEKEFIELFIIALRAYFDDSNIPKANLPYENSALQLIADNWNEDKLDKKAIKKKIFSFYSENYKKSGKQFSERYYSMLEDIGWNNNKTCTYKHLIELLWTIKYLPKFDFEDIQKIGFDITLPKENNILIDILRADYNCEINDNFINLK